MVNLEWIWEHTKGHTVDDKPTDFTWDTGIKHDASNSRPEFSKLLYQLNERVRKQMVEQESSHGTG